ncbi:MAG: insulinase family protein [Vicinamibacterales bacterium]
MTRRLSLQLAFIAGALGLAASLAGAPRQPAQVARDKGPLAATIPTDPQITTGRFANGLRYYIRRNTRPQNRAELRLVVNAGSVLEEDDQQGLAHFVEHMAFNGTTHFPKMAIVSFMESIGMRFGPSVNAFTSFDETVYMLQIPTERAEVIDKALLVLEDWAHNVSFGTEEINKERGVITEEWRLRRGAAARVQDKQLPMILQNSRYAGRIPIGKMEIVQNFNPDRLRQFYKDWYRPDLMAVIAVGDFNPADVQALVTKHFGAIAPSATPKKRPTFAVPGHPGTTFAIATDKEVPTTQVSVYNMTPARDQSTIGSYRQQQIVDGLFSSMLNARFAEIAEKPNAPFLAAHASRGQIVRTAEAATLGAVVKEDGIEKGLESIFAEAQRVAQFGFTATELDRQKVSSLRRLERAITEKDNQQSADLAAEYSRNYLNGEPIPGIVYENALYQRFMPGITLAEINQLAKTWWPDRNRVVAVTAPDKPGVVIPTEARLSAAMTRAGGPGLKAYEDAGGGRALLESVPTPGRVVSTNVRTPFGITEWKLSNGATIVLKPTTFRQDEIMFRAFSPGGTSLASDRDFIAAITAAQVVSAGGLGQMSSNELGKALTGKLASVRPSIGALDEGVAGTGSMKDAETLFQMIYLTFTQPRVDPEIFKVILDQTRTALANQSARPEYAFGLALGSALSQDHPRARPMTLDLVNEMDLAKSVAFYKDRFADASDFTFVFVGSFDPAKLQPLVEQYIGSLPALHRQESWKDVGIRYPHTVVERRVEKGIEPKSQTATVFTGTFQYDQSHRTAIRAMAMALETRLRGALREELGGTYSVSVSAGYSKIPTPEYSVSINFGADPTRLNALAARVSTEIERLKTSGVTEQELSDVREALLREYEAGTKSNSYLMSNIAGRYQLGESLESFFTLDASYRSLTAATIQDAARTYLNPQSVVRVTLVPEK